MASNVAYDEKKYRQGIDTSYYDKAVKQYTAQANQQRNQQIAEAQKTQQANLKNAYISRLQNEQKLNNNLAMSGIRGGMTETSNLNLANQYGQARAAANSDYANSVNQINQSINQNIADYRSDMDSRAEQYRQNLAQAKWQAAREDKANEIARQREDKNNEIARQTEYWSNYYTNYYSGFKKKDVKKAYKALEKQLAKTKDPMQRLKLEQAISGARARLGVINNK